MWPLSRPLYIHISIPSRILVHIHIHPLDIVMATAEPQMTSAENGNFPVLFRQPKPLPLLQSPAINRFPCSVATWLHFGYTYWMHVVHSSDPHGKMGLDEVNWGNWSREQAARVEWIWNKIKWNLNFCVKSENGKGVVCKWQSKRQSKRHFFTILQAKIVRQLYTIY